MLSYGVMINAIMYIFDPHCLGPFGRGQATIQNQDHPSSPLFGTFWEGSGPYTKSRPSIFPIVWDRLGGVRPRYKIKTIHLPHCLGPFGRGQAPIQNQDRPSSELSTCLPWWFYALHLGGSGPDSVSNCPYKIHGKHACLRGSTPWF